MKSLIFNRVIDRCSYEAPASCLRQLYSRSITMSEGAGGNVTCELRALAVRKRRKGYGCTGRGTDAAEEVRKHRKRYGSTGIRSPYTIILAFIYTAALPAVERQA
jgi:hypothetical protein